jgi:peptide/nickel transport system substrate-binding protein
VLVVAVMIAASCHGSSSSSGRASTTTAVVPVRTGGTLMFGLEDEPGCLDWIGTCGATTAGYWAANVTTLPRPFSVERVGAGWAYRRTNLLVAEPTLVTAPKQVVTYRINPKAVWSDGQPITAADFAYTWQQVVKGANVEDRSDYRDIESIDVSDTGTAIVTFATPVADWKALFGGRVGVLPAHLLASRDRTAEMAGGYGWSGGPWKIAAWKKGADLTLVPNERYWGRKPKLDKVTFTFVRNGDEALQAFKGNELLGFAPRTNLDAIRSFARSTEMLRATDTTETLDSVGLAFNVRAAPFDDARVRRAVAFAVDRDAIAKDPPVSFTPSLLGSFVDRAFAGFRRDTGQVDSLMRGAGWRKGSDGVWAKRGVRAAVALSIASEDRELDRVVRLLVPQLEGAGFEASSVASQSALLEKQLTTGNFGATVRRFSLRSFYPDGCALWCSSNIPAPGNAFAGDNVFRVADAKLDRFLAQVDTTLDVGAAASANRQAETLLASGTYVVPLEVVPTVVMTSTKIVGTVTDNPVMGPFWKLDTWGLR